MGKGRSKSTNIIFLILFILVFYSIIELTSGLVLTINNYFNLRKKQIVNREQRIKLKDDLNEKLVEQFYQEKDNAKIEYRSFIGWRHLQFKGKVLNIDSCGIRKTIPNNHNGERIIFMGGSTMWGMGVNDENTIPSLFSKYSNIKYNILNLGESGYCAYQSLLYLQLKLLDDERPSLVISMDGTNNTPIQKGYFKHSREKQIKDLLKGADSRVFSFKSNFLDLIRGSLNHKLGKEKINEESNYLAAVELLETWLLMKEKCKSINAKFYCILQPNIFVGHPNISNLTCDIKKHPYSNGYDYYRMVLLLLNEKKYCNLKDNFKDFTSVFDSIPNIYIDFCHVFPKGNEIIAKEIIQEVKFK